MEVEYCRCERREVFGFVEVQAVGGWVVVDSFYPVGSAFATQFYFAVAVSLEEMGGDEAVADGGEADEFGLRRRERDARVIHTQEVRITLAIVGRMKNGVDTTEDLFRRKFFAITRINPLAEFRF